MLELALGALATSIKISPDFGLGSGGLGQDSPTNTSRLATELYSRFMQVAIVCPLAGHKLEPIMWTCWMGGAWEIKTITYMVGGQAFLLFCPSHIVKNNLLPL